jgi:hypothetical protein
MANNDESDILNGADEPEQDFEAYLSQKLKEFEWKPSEIPTTDLPANDVVESSSSVPSQPKGESETSSSSGDAHDVVSDERLREINGPTERAPKLTLHSHPLVGHYITESSEPIIYDEELKKVYFSTFAVMTTDADNVMVLDPDVARQRVETIIERIHELYRSIAVVNMQISGMRWSMSHLLELVNANDRSKLIELDRKERAARGRKVKAVGSGSTDDAAGKRARIGKAPSTTRKTKGQQAADTCHGLEYDKEATERKLKTLNLLDESTQEYIDKLFAR